MAYVRRVEAATEVGDPGVEFHYMPFLQKPVAAL